MTDAFDHFILLEDKWGFADKSEVRKDVFHDWFFEENVLGSDILFE